MKSLLYLFQKLSCKNPYFHLFQKGGLSKLQNAILNKKFYTFAQTQTSWIQNKSINFYTRLAQIISVFWKFRTKNRNLRQISQQIFIKIPPFQAKLGKLPETISSKVPKFATFSKIIITKLWPKCGIPTEGENSVSKDLGWRKFRGESKCSPSGWGNKLL